MSLFSADPRVEECEAERKALRAERDQWVPAWEDVGFFIHNRRYKFVGGTNTTTPDLPYGSFAPYDSTYTSYPAVAMNKLSAALLGMLWKNGARTFQLKRTKNIPDTAETKAFYDNVMNPVTISAMEHPHARLTTSLGEDMRETVSFGVGGIGVFKSGDKTAPVLYKPYSVRNCTLIEDEAGRIDGVYIEDELSMAKAFGRYGEAVLPDNRAIGYNPKTDTAKVVVVQCIKPNPYAVAGSLAANQMPYMSLHYRQKDGKILRDSGYAEMPIKFSRFEKNTEETYARCPGIDSLPSVRELHWAVREFKLGSEKDSNIPFAMLDDGTFGGGTVDRSPGAVTIVDVSGRISGNPLIPLHSAPNRQPQFENIKMLKEEIGMTFFLDQILDLNNNTRQTGIEANIRNEMRSEPLTGIMTRQLEEKFIPLIEATVNLLYSENAYGVIEGSENHRMALAIGENPDLIPDDIARAIANGEDFYEIAFVSPASRMMRAEELRGVANVLSMAAQLAQVDGGKALRRYDTMAIGELNDELNGVPGRVVKPKDQYEAEEQALAEQQSMMAQSEMVAKEAEINQKNAAAAQSQAQAQATQTGANGMFGAMGGRPPAMGGGAMGGM